MKSSVDHFVQLLRKEILEETKEAYGERAFERWREPLYRGAMEHPDAHGVLRGGCGDAMEIFLKFEHDRVSQASFLTDGCGASTVCASFAAEIAVGKTPDELSQISSEDIIEKAGGLPQEDRHLAFLAAQTLHEALNHYKRQQTG